MRKSLGFSSIGKICMKDTGFTVEKAQNLDLEKEAQGRSHATRAKAIRSLMKEHAS